MIDWDRKIVGEGLSFDDILLIPAESSVLPKETDVRTWIRSPRPPSPSLWPEKAA